MIGLVLRALTGGLLPGPGFFTVLFGSALACCAICGIYKCSHFRMRDCSCIKRCMRASGADKFDDFEMMVVVHEALYTSNKPKLSTVVRLTAGAHTVKTDESNKGIFQQPLAVFVEQGCDVVNVELLDARERKVLAVLKLDTISEILEAKVTVSEKVFFMTQKNKGVLNPRIKLTVHLDSGDEVEKGLLAGITMSTEADLMLRQQLNKVVLTQEEHEGVARGALSELELLAKGCCGPLDMFGSWGSREAVYMAVRGPPDYRKHVLCIFKDEQECQRSQKPKEEVDLLRIQSIQPDPSRSDVFIVHYVQSEKVKRKLTFRRIDRARDVWVEMLQLMIKMLREAKDRKKVKGPS